MATNYFSDQNRRGKLFGWYVYLLAEEGADFCKIGTASCVASRVDSLTSGNPRRLTVVKSWHLIGRPEAFKVEKWALEFLADVRLPGRDWVRCSAHEAEVAINRAVSLYQCAVRAEAA